MAQLRVALTDAGLVEVRTYIQSGNVIARSQLGHAGVSRLVHAAIQQRIGADIAVITRTPGQLVRMLERNPFADADPSRLYFSLLGAPPSAPYLQALLETNFAPDRVSVMGDTIYTLYATRYSDSRFNNNFFERKLKVSATTRNFNTLSRLAAFT